MKKLKDNLLTLRTAKLQTLQTKSSSSTLIVWDPWKSFSKICQWTRRENWIFKNKNITSNRISTIIINRLPYLPRQFLMIWSWNLPVLRICIKHKTSISAIIIKKMKMKILSLKEIASKVAKLNKESFASMICKLQLWKLKILLLKKKQSFILKIIVFLTRLKITPGIAL